MNFNNVNTLERLTNDHPTEQKNLTSNYPLQNNKELSLHYKESYIPTNIPLSMEILKNLFSSENLNTIMTTETIQRIQQYLPLDHSNLISSPRLLSSLLSDTITKFQTPLSTFYSMYQVGFFSEYYQLYNPLFKEASLDKYISEYSSLIKALQQNKQSIEKESLNEIYTNISSNDNLVTFNMRLELASSGYSSAESVRGDSHSVNGGDYNGHNDLINSSRKKNGNNINNMNGNYSNLSDNDFSGLESNAYNRFKHLKKNKNLVTIKPRSPEEVKNFQKQEQERYKNPSLPWEYTLSNGCKCVVAPLFKKNKPNPTKAREHPLLKPNRPSYITILSLVRDAASKLQDGVGTRADICDLLKDSQYLKENSSLDDISSVVSGALDRLHYEKDPCVQYDQNQKLWKYLHRNRPLDYPEWKDNGNEDKKFDNSAYIAELKLKLKEEEHLPDNENVSSNDGIIFINKQAFEEGFKLSNFSNQNVCHKKSKDTYLLGKKHSHQAEDVLNGNGGHHHNHKRKKIKSDITNNE